MGCVGSVSDIGLGSLDKVCSGDIFPGSNGAVYNLFYHMLQDIASLIVLFMNPMLSSFEVFGRINGTMSQLPHV